MNGDSHTHYGILNTLVDRLDTERPAAQDAIAAHDLVLDVREKALRGAGTTDQIEAAARAVTNAMHRTTATWRATCHEVYAYVTSNDIDGRDIDVLSRLFDDMTPEESANFANPLYAALNAVSGGNWSSTTDYADM